MKKIKRLFPKTMQAYISTKYGNPEVLVLKEVETPIPRNDEVLIKVRSASVSAADSMMRQGTPFYARLFLGLRKPSKAIPGTGFAGTVVAAGKDITSFKVKDDVFGETGINFSAHAQYICLKEGGLLEKKPKSISFAEAACVCDGALTSYNFLINIAKIKPKSKVLVNGAAGSLGSAAVQLAKHSKAEVTAVCSAKNFAFVKKLGAKYCVDYNSKTNTDFAEKKYDYIFDTVGKSSFNKSKQAITANGAYLSPVLSFTLLFQMIYSQKFGKAQAIFSATGLKSVAELKVMLHEVTKLLKSKKLKVIVSKKYPFTQLPEAHHHVDSGHKRGSVVVQL